MYIYTVYDTIAKVGSNLFLSTNDRTAYREFQKLFENKEKNTKKEYKLLKLGLYDNIINEEAKEIKIYAFEPKEITEECINE